MAKPIEDLPGEIWKPVVSYEGLYEISNHGRVWSTRHNRLLSPTPVRNGHRRIRLSNGTTERHIYVHRLVLEAFVGPCPDGMECCHNDGDPDNNFVGNLRWDTRRANLLDRYRHGGMPDRRGEGCPTSKLTTEQVVQIRKEYKRGGVTMTELGKRYGVCNQMVSRIINRQSWANIE